MGLNGGFLVFEIKNRTELWINKKYHGSFGRIEDMLDYVHRWTNGEFLPEVSPQQRLEWD